MAQTQQPSPSVLLAVGIQAGAGAGNATGAVTAEEDAREIPVGWVVRDGYFFFPTGKGLDYLCLGRGGACGRYCRSSVSLFLITVVNILYVFWDMITELVNWLIFVEIWILCVYMCMYTYQYFLPYENCNT